MIKLTNIQRFSLHDGPGIRTTVFLKGCNLRCPWCANPENLYQQVQQYIKDGVEGFYGKQMTPEEVFDEVIKDKPFYEDGGGVTFSGGEALVQQNELEPLFQMLRNAGINIAVETALFVSDIQIALRYIDLFIIDIKILDKERCREVEKGNLDIYFHNIDTVLNSNKPIIFRIPVIGGYTDTEENQKLVIEFLKKHMSKNIRVVQMIKEHNLGLQKYRSLNAADPSISIPNYKGVSDEIMTKYRNSISRQIPGINVEICKV